jgi:hypothetical protein
MGNWCDSSCPFFMECQMQKNTISIVACVLSVAAMLTSVVAVTRSGKSEPEAKHVEQEAFDKAQKEIDERFLTHMKGSLDTNNLNLKRDIEISKRVGVLEEKAGITPQGN